ncbi:MAG: GAF domain-containing protein [Bacteroidales bacterium]|nr:GAF domain-containing protein [Bacteroidales bacterium]
MKTDKENRYEELLSKVEAVTFKETDYIANMANISALIKESFGFLWVGFYIVKDDELVLGPFQGPIACTRIKKGRGVCGTAWQNEETIVVPDVEKFPGHISCSSLSKSEIVVPIIRNDNVFAVLDIDSENLDTFDDVDALYLKKIIDCI